jgi:hypothetical protein
MAKEKKRVCCNCGNNTRVKDAEGMVTHCQCAIDGHLIGYTECFEGWCRRWKKDRKWDEVSANKKEDIESPESAKYKRTQNPWEVRTKI